VHLGQHSDAELVRLAKAGWSPAFAVLVHRHAPTVHAALRDDPDPLSATTAVFVHAMRELRQRDAGAPLGPWLLELIDRPPPAQPSTLSTDELDAMWLELDRRWPDGERPATTWPWRRLAIVAGVVVLAAAVPAIVLGIDAPPEAGEVELRAVPVTDDGPPPDTDDADESLPTFSFPVAPDDDGADDAEPETTEPAPEPETPPTDPEPEPQPEPQPTPEPQPEPTPEPEPSATDEEDGGSVLDPVLGGDDGGGEGDGNEDDGGGEGESADSGEAAASEPS
jgi:hypothetical protein